MYNLPSLVSKFNIHAPAFIQGTIVSLRSRRLFELGILNEDYVLKLLTSSLSTYFSFFRIYTMIFKLRLPSTIIIVLQTKTDETNYMSFS